MSEKNTLNDKNPATPALTDEGIRASGMIEDYLLERLGPAEREAFEEHYLDCEACLEDLETARRLQQAGRRLAADQLREQFEQHRQRRAPSRERLWQRVAALAAVALLALLGATWQRERTFADRQRASDAALAAALDDASAPAANAPLLTLGLLRGNDAPAGRLTLGAGDRQAVLLVAVPADGPYKVELRRGRDPIWQSPEGARANTRGDLVLTLPVKLLPPGAYTLHLDGPEGALDHHFEVARR